MPREYTPLRPLELVIGPSIAYVPLTQGFYALIDLDDAAEVGKVNWYTSILPGNAPYATHRKHTLHRVLMGLPKLFVDHVNGRTLDNRRVNLRLATHSQNRCNTRLAKNNTSGFKGVSWSKTHQKYVAQIAENGKTVHLGAYGDPEMAYRVYCRAAAHIQGEYVRLAPAKPVG